MRILKFTFLGLLLALPVQAVSHAQHADVFLGEVVIEVFKGYGIGVTVDRIGADPADGVAEDVLILEAHARIPVQLPMDLGASRVIFRGDRLLVVSLEERRAVGLFLDGVDAGEVEDSIQHALGRAHGGPGSSSIFMHAGHGLSHHRGRFILPIEAWPPSELDASGLGSKGEILAQADTDECQSGGVGSSSCSVTCGAINYGCSVTCVTGYYACCNCGIFVAICDCIEDGSSGGSGDGGDGGGDDECSGDNCDISCMNCGPAAT